MDKVNVTPEQLRDSFDYDASTGLFTHKKKISHLTKVGSIAGWTNVHGYTLISIRCHEYQAHRLAWLYVHGVWPKNLIDHIDGDRANNRISNLREATHAINTQNIKRAYSNNVIGVLGVRKKDRRFAAYLRVDGKIRWLGSFKTAELAYEAYLQAKRKHHPGFTL